MDKQKALSILHDYLHEKAKDFGIRSLGIFGSVARDEATDESDVDVIVDVEPVRFQTLARIQRELSERLGAKVDLVRKRNEMNSLLRECIEEEAVYA